MLRSHLTIHRVVHEPTRFATGTSVLHYRTWLRSDAQHRRQRQTQMTRAHAVYSVNERVQHGAKPTPSSHIFHQYKYAKYLSYIEVSSRSIPAQEKLQSNEHRRSLYKDKN